jgi:hypothetical protein
MSYMLSFSVDEWRWRCASVYRERRTFGIRIAIRSDVAKRRSFAHTGDRPEEMYRRVSVQLRSLQPLVCKDDDDELVEHITRGVKVNQPSRTEAAERPPRQKRD